MFFSPENIQIMNLQQHENAHDFTAQLTLETGTPEVFDNTIKIYPNPVNAGDFTIHLSEAEVLKKLRIFDMLGNLAYQEEAKEAKSVYPLTVFLQSGMYIVEISTTGGVYEKRVVVY